jgi:putative Mg2+ transporter-C (MgtC) family protein
MGEDRVDPRVMNWQSIVETTRDVLRDPFVVESARRLVFAVALSAIVGYERQRKGQAAGIRTHILVCIGSTLLMIVSEAIADAWRKQGATIWLDQGRIAAGIVTGVGFLGAGTIVHRGHDQHGLTTAAMIWFVAALGIAIGSGMYFLSALSTVLVTLVVVGLDRSSGFSSRAYYTIRVTLRNDDLDIAGMSKRLSQGKKFRVQAEGFRTADDKRNVIVLFKVQAHSEKLFVGLQQRVMEQLPEAREIDIFR